jgi:hypothetical protein
MTLTLKISNFMLSYVNNKEKEIFLILFYVNVMLIYVEYKLKIFFFIYAIFTLIMPISQTDGRTDKRIKIIVRNLTKYTFKIVINHKMNIIIKNIFLK